VKVPERPATIGLTIGAITSLALMLRAGHHQRSIILVLLSAAWVLSPFFGLGYAHLSSKRWLRSARVVLYALTVLVVFGCPAIYASVAFGRTTLKMGLVFLVIPFVCWLLIGFLICVALLSSRKAWRQGDGSRKKLAFPHG
jgi:peptidoglycan biosynthesis protein MviN/MurJ (putative lipid II flippase)